MRMTLQEAIEAGVVFPASRLAAPTQGGGGVSFSLPVEIVSEANRRDHWAARYRRTKSQKRAAHLGVLQHASSLRRRIRAGEDIRLVITLVRLLRPRQRRFGSDNLASGFKAIRDGVASALGIDDGSDRLEWHYAQEPGGGQSGGVRVTIARIDL